MTKLLSRIWSKLDDLLSPIRDRLSKINKALDKYFNVSWLFSSLTAKLSVLFLGIFSIIDSIASMIFAILNFGSLVDILKGTVIGSSYWLEKLENIVSGYSSIQGLVTTLDGQFAALSSFLSPPVTFTYLLQITGIGDAFNKILVCSVQGIAFVISMRLLFWSLGRVKLQMVKPIK